MLKTFKNFEFKKISWFKVGGLVKQFTICSSLEELKQAIAEFKRQDTFDSNKIRIIGNCSNILMSDDGFDGLIIKLGKEFNKLELIDNQRIKCSSSCLSAEVSNFAMENELSNLEFLYTIPGCIGGNVYMNAGCYKHEIKDYLEEIQVFNMNTLDLEIIKKEEIKFEYRKSNLTRNYIILSATFKCIKSKKEEIKTLMQSMNKSRLESQPIAVKTCGSTFKNPNGNYAWKLIDEVGLRNYKIGGAKFSEKHSNFIINEGNASSSDIVQLINLAKEKVKEKFNIDLEVEIEYL